MFTLPHLVGRSALVLTLIVAVWRGGRPERLGIAIVALGWVATPIVERRQSWYEPQFGIMAVDAAILAAFVVIAFRYGRYWTLLAAGFQSIAVLTHFAFLIDPHALYRAYYFENYSIGFLILGAIFGGAFIEGRRPYRQRPFPWLRPRSRSS